MHTKAISRFIIVSPGRIVIEYPSCVLCTAGFVDKMPDLLIVTIPKPAYPTVLAVLLPQLRVDMSIGVERCNEFIAVIGAARAPRAAMPPPSRREA
jgi:hypothetical protein